MLGKRIFKLSPIEKKVIWAYKAICPSFWKWAQKRGYRHRKNRTRSNYVYWDPNLQLETIKSILTSRLRGTPFLWDKNLHHYMWKPFSFQYPDVAENLQHTFVKWKHVARLRSLYDFIVHHIRYIVMVSKAASKEGWRAGLESVCRHLEVGNCRLECSVNTVLCFFPFMKYSIISFHWLWTCDRQFLTSPMEYRCWANFFSRQSCRAGFSWKRL